MSKSLRAVSVKEIRTAFQNGTLSVADVTDEDGNPVNPASVLGAGGDVSRVRGRVNPAFSAHFVASTPGTTYAEKTAEGKTVTLPLVKLNAKGARMQKPEAFPIAQVRALAGAPERGRLSAKHITDAAQAVQTERGW